ncbi:MAG: M55 family metallopeptidase [Rhodoferax sp.]
MKVLISTDIEGIAGVFRPEQTRPGNAEYDRACLLMTGEANAAIAGAFDAGATEVWVNDSHGNFNNMPAHLLDPRAQAILGKPRYLSMVAGVEQGVDALCLIGYHSRAQGRGVLAHTINGFAFARVCLNGQELGEAGIYGALAGEFGVPVVMASGDDVFIDENQSIFAQTTFVQTKRATGQTSCISLSPDQSCSTIRAGVAKALGQRKRVHPFVLSGLITVRLQTQTPALADLFCQWPSLQRLSGDEISFDAPSVQAAVRMINCFSAMSTMLR